MSVRLHKIDEQSLPDHYYLTDSDECYYFGLYTANKDYSHSKTNRLIKNFKKEMSLRNTSQWRYKKEAIKEVGKLISSKIDPNYDRSKLIIVPVPPSRIKSDPDYDHRLVLALECASKYSKVNLPVIECVTQINNTSPDHLSNETRLGPVERAKNYMVHCDKILANTRIAVVFDDVLTTGSHFKAVEIAIHSKFPHIKVIGLFVARRVFNKLSAEETFKNVNITQPTQKNSD